MHSPQQNSHPQQFAIQSAVALNNMAVTLMEHACYEQAFEILRGAIMAVQLAGNTKQCNSPSQQRDLLRSSLQDAKDHSINLRPAKVLISLRVLYNNDPIRSFDCSNHGKTSYILISIREDDPLFLQDCCLEILMATVLYNVSISLLCKGHVYAAAGMDHTDQSRKIHVDALTSLKTAHDLLEKFAFVHKSFRKIGSSQSCTAMLVFSRYLALSTILLLTLQQIFEALGRKDHAIACVMKLSHIRNLATVSNDNQQRDSTKDLAAAA